MWKDRKKVKWGWDGGGFPLNGDLWKILRVEKIGKEIMRWLENFSTGRA